MKADGKSTLRTRWQLVVLVLVIFSCFYILYMGHLKFKTRSSYYTTNVPDESGRKQATQTSLLESSSSSKSGNMSPKVVQVDADQEYWPTEDGQLSQMEYAARHSKLLPVAFDPHGNDTLVMIHIQKTGGTEFLRHLVTVTQNGEVLCKLSERTRKSIQKKQKLPREGKLKGKARILTSCPRYRRRPNGEQWLISEKTMRWICGLHASYMEFRNCLPKLISPKFNWNRKLHYAVFLRHPVLRYISEFLHVQRNASWASRHICHGQLVPLVDMPPCYPGFYNKTSWPNLTLSGFISCESNWANNRQTLMLADLEAVGCFNKQYLSKDDRERIILETAKTNLKSFSFFGLTEYMNESCGLFEKQFKVHFPVLPPLRNLSDIHSGPMLPNLWSHPTFFNAILRANFMDMELYKFALDLFSERARDAGIIVNKERVEQEIGLLRANPLSLKKPKFKKLNYTIS